MPFAIVNFGFTQVSELLDKKQNLESYDDDNDYDKLRRSNNCCKCPQYTNTITQSSTFTI